MFHQQFYINFKKPSSLTFQRMRLFFVTDDDSPLPNGKSPVHIFSALFQLVFSLDLINHF